MGDIYHAGNTYAGSVPIDDTQTTATNTWSAQKINNEIDTKVSKSIITSNDVFDPTKAYVAGDWLIHNNILYEVLVACTGVTPPNSTYYKVKTLHDLQSEISALITSMDHTATTDANGSIYIPVSLKQVLSVYSINPSSYAMVRPSADGNRNVVTIFDADARGFRVMPNTEITCRIIYKV